MNFTLSDEFVMLPEGSYVFTIKDIVYDTSNQEFGDVTVTLKLETEDHKKHDERYFIYRGGVLNEIAQRNLTHVYNAAMKTKAFNQTIDLDVMKDHKFKANIKHSEYADKKTGVIKKAANIRDIAEAEETANIPVDITNSLADLFG